MNKDFMKKTAVFVIFMFGFFLWSESFPTDTANQKQDKELLQQGEELYKNGEYEKALTVFEEAEPYIKDTDKRLTLYFHMSLTHFALGNSNQTEESLRKLFGLDPVYSIIEENYPRGFIQIFNKLKTEIKAKIEAEKSTKEKEKKKEKVIEKPRPKVPGKKKKKFPLLLVIGGVAVVGLVVILLSKKKKTEKYTLTVNEGEGIDGNPNSGSYTYNKGETVNYNYSLQAGYSNLSVTLDGSAAGSSGTITMDRNHTLSVSAVPNEVNFSTDKDLVEVPEGSTAVFNVKLSAQPSTDINVTIAYTGGDNDIIVKSGSNLTFTQSNWDIYQTVTLEAHNDVDSINGEATIRISATGITSKDITAIEMDSDTLNFITNTNNVRIPEGDEATFKVKLSAEPSSSKTAQVTRISGDSDIQVKSGLSLTFTKNNWNTYQTVKLEAFKDPDIINGEAVIRISAPGIANKDITATEDDNDGLNFVANTDNVTVPEGGSVDFQVKLSAAPTSNVTANVNRVSGDSDITIKTGSNLTFTTSNWNNYQTVTLEATEDSDTTNGQATIRISAPGISNKDITATENDNDQAENLAPNPSFEYGSGNSPNSWTAKIYGSEYVTSADGDIIWSNKYSYMGSRSVGFANPDFEETQEGGVLIMEWTSDFIDVDPSNIYELSFKYMYVVKPPINTNNTGVEWGIYEYDSNGNFVAGNGRVGSGHWADINVWYTGTQETVDNQALSANTSKVKIQLEFTTTDKDSGVEVYFDSVVFTKKQ